MKNKLWFAIIVVGVLGVFAAALVKGTTPNAGKGPTVSIITVERGAAEQDVLAEGTIIPSKLVNVSVLPSIEAKILDVKVDIGTRVTEGQLLAVLDPIEKQPEVDTWKTTLDSNKQMLQLAKVPYRPEEIDEIRQEVKQYQAALDLVLHPYRPEDIERKALDLANDTNAIKVQEDKLKVLRNTSLPEQIIEAERAVDTYAAQYTLAKADNARNKTLFAKGLIARADMEASDTGLKVAEDSLVEGQQKLKLVRMGSRPELIHEGELALEQLKVTLAADKLAYKEMRDGSRPEQIQEAKAKLKAAQNKLSLMLQGSRPEAIKQREDAVQTAQITLNQQLLYQNRRFVRAPISGVILARNINAGEVVRPAAETSVYTDPLVNDPKAAFTIGDDSAVDFSASVDQRYIHSIKVGQQATVTIEAMPGRAFTGTIVKYNPMINPDRVGRGGSNTTINPTAPLTFPVWVRIANPSKLLVSGQLGLLNVAHKMDGILLPQSAVTSFALGEGIVYVEENGVLHKRNVRFDGNADGYFRVSEGVKEGDHVVVSDPTNLTDNMPVQTVPAGPEMLPAHP